MADDPVDVGYAAGAAPDSQPRESQVPSAACADLAPWRSRFPAWPTPTRSSWPGPTCTRRLAGGHVFCFGVVLGVLGFGETTSSRPFFVLASASGRLRAAAAPRISSPCRCSSRSRPPFARYASRPPFKAWVGVARRSIGLLAARLPLAPTASSAIRERFDSVFEFGVHYQVTLQPFTGNLHTSSPHLLVLVRPAGRSPVSSSFVSSAMTLSSWHDLPPGYQSFERAGVPAWRRRPGSCLVLLGLADRRVLRESDLGSQRRLAAPGFTRHEVWPTLCSAAIVLSMVPVLSLWEASMQASCWRRRWRDRARGLARGVLAPPTELSGAAAVMLGFVTRGLVLAPDCKLASSAHSRSSRPRDDQLRAKNPFLYQALEDHLSLCSPR